MPGIGAHHEHNAAAADDFALFTHATDAGANLHTGVRGDGRPRLQLDQDDERKASEYRRRAPRITRGALLVALFLQLTAKKGANRPPLREKSSPCTSGLKTIESGRPVKKPRFSPTESSAASDSALYPQPARVHLGGQKTALNDEIRPPTQNRSLRFAQPAAGVASSSAVGAGRARTFLVPIFTIGSTAITRPGSS